MYGAIFSILLTFLEKWRRGQYEKSFFFSGIAIIAIAITVKTVFSIMNNSSFKEKDQLLEIAARWKKGDFSKIVDEHNYFWNLQGETIGKAYGKLSKTEEETFILNNFGEEAAKQ